MVAGVRAGLMQTSTAVCQWCAFRLASLHVLPHQFCKHKLDACVRVPWCAELPGNAPYCLGDADDLHTWSSKAQSSPLRLGSTP